MQTFYFSGAGGINIPCWMNPALWGSLALNEEHHLNMLQWTKVSFLPTVATSDWELHLSRNYSNTEKPQGHSLVFSFTPRGYFWESNIGVFALVCCKHPCCERLSLYQSFHKHLHICKPMKVSLYELKKKKKYKLCAIAHHREKSVLNVYFPNLLG